MFNDLLIPVLMLAAALAGYLLAEWTRSAPPPAPQTNPDPEPAPRPEPTPPGPAPAPAAPYSRWADDWLVKWGGFLEIEYHQGEQLDEWAMTLAKIAYTQFGGRVSARHKLFPFLQDNPDYDHIPPRWKSQHSLEKLQQIWRDAGLVEQSPRRNEGLRLTKKGIYDLWADPEEWHP